MKTVFLFLILSVSCAVIELDSAAAVEALVKDDSKYVIMVYKNGCHYCKAFMPIFEQFSSRKGLKFARIEMSQYFTNKFLGPVRRFPSVFYRKEESIFKYFGGFDEEAFFKFVRRISFECSEQKREGDHIMAVSTTKLGLFSSLVDKIAPLLDNCVLSKESDYPDGSILMRINNKTSLLKLNLNFQSLDQENMIDSLKTGVIEAYKSSALEYRGEWDKYYLLSDLFVVVAYPDTISAEQTALLEELKLKNIKFLSMAVNSSRIPHDDRLLGQVVLRDQSTVGVFGTSISTSMLIKNEQMNLNYITSIAKPIIPELSPNSRKYVIYFIFYSILFYFGWKLTQSSKQVKSE